jgi:hypothetical protein
MRLVLSSLVSAMILSSSSASFAQIGVGVKPTIRATQIPMPMNQINLQNIADDILFHLDFTVSASPLDTYMYEISYDLPATITIPTVPLVALDPTINNNYGMNPGNLRVNAPYDFTIRASQITSSTTARNNATRVIEIRVYRAANRLDENTAAEFGWSFNFDTLPPPAPSITGVTGGEQSLHVEWTIGDETDVNTYDVVYCPDVRTLVDTSTTSTATVVEFDPKTCPNLQITENVPKTQHTQEVQDGLANGVPAAVAVRAVDLFANKGPTSKFVIARPTKIFDFWNFYKASGGQETGGCFIATAAYGSYAHPVVWVLRQFRDRVLKATPIGTALVWAYYRFSPPLAAEVAKDPALAAWVRAGLVPIAAIAIAWMLVPLGGLFTLGLLIARRSKRARRAIAPSLPILIAAGALLLSGEARAEERARKKPQIEAFGIGIEIKGGPYRPEIANDTGGAEGNAAFSQVYGSNSRPLFSIGVDLQLFRSFGTAGVGGSFGFLQYVGRGFRTLPMPGQTSERQDTTVFNELPLNLVAFYRFDYLADNSGFPLVPYAKAGLAYHLWWTTNGIGDISRYQPKASDAASDQVGRGGKWGIVGTVGLAILLNALEPISSHRLYELTGIRGTYVFAELQYQKVDSFGGSGFDLSDKTWNVGLYLEI